MTDAQPGHKGLPLAYPASTLGRPAVMTVRPRIQRCFIGWLETARPRLSIQPRVTRRSDCLLQMAFDGLPPAIGAHLSRFEIDVWVEWDGVGWDLVFNEYIQVAGRRGAYVCEACPPEARTTYASREALWRDHLFEAFLTWINNTLAPASALALYRSDLGSTWVKLLRDGEMSGDRPPDVVIPLWTGPQRP